ncbi:MAG: radical SAM protein [Candidatus Omnitrophica bacterium]|nr:radical SAM protein [Candidatus Omnitrophota bacterium]
MEDLRIDSHKLIYHVKRVNDWLNGKNIYPIFLDVSPTSACNHNCVFCGLDYTHKVPVTLKTKVLKDMVKDCAKNGVKSIMYAGEGEPLLHKELAQIINFTHDQGIDVALNTNGVLFDKTFCKKALKDIVWSRVSIDAGTKKTHKMLHNAKEDDFDKILSNLTDAVDIKKKNKFKTTIGTQFLLLKENANELSTLASKLSKIGVDYLIVKPYSKHPLSINNIAEGLNYKDMMDLDKSLNKYRKKINIIFRKKTMEKRFSKKNYDRCLGAPFWAYIAATGDIYPCHNFLGVQKFSMGNLNDNSFSSIWKSEKRKKIMDFLYTKNDVQKCRELCRLDAVNEYLWELTHPGEHVNFI